MPFSPADRTELKTAVDEWCADSVAAEVTYGHISTWDVGAVTDFSRVRELIALVIPMTNCIKATK